MQGWAGSHLATPLVGVSGQSHSYTRRPPCSGLPCTAIILFRLRKVQKWRFEACDCGFKPPPSGISIFLSFSFLLSSFSPPPLSFSFLFPSCPAAATTSQQNLQLLFPKLFIHIYPLKKSHKEVKREI